MIKLFDVKDKEFKTNGIMNIMPLSLIEYKDTSLNGWKIETEIPIKYNDNINDGMIAYIETKSKGGQPFRITNIKRTDKTLQINANHIVFDSKDYVLEDVRPTNMSAAGALKYVNDRTETQSPFTTNSNVSGVNTAYFINKTLLEAFDTIQERWGGVYDVDNFLIELRSKVGVDRGDTIMYGKNLEGLSVYEDWSAVVTKLLPVGFDGITLPEKYLYSEHDYGRPFTKVVRFETKLDDEDRTEEKLIAELRENAIAYLKENEVPKISYEVVSNVNQELGMGDIIHVKHPVVDILTEVIAYEYNVLTKRVEKITFGNYRRSVEKKVNVIKDIINKIEDKTNSFDVIIQDQTELINSLNKYGYVYQDDNQIMIVDKLPKEEAKKVWRWNAGGLGYSKNGIEGPFEYAWTMDGTFNTNFISANSIMTNQLHSDVGSSLDISSNKYITQIVENIDRIRLDENLIYNMNGEYDMDGWLFDGGYLTFGERLRFYKGMTFNPTFVPIEVQSLSINALKFIRKGKATSNAGYIVPNTIYSLKLKREQGTQAFKVTVLEYDKIDGQTIKRTPFIFSDPKQYEKLSIQPDERTTYIRLEFETLDDSVLILTEMMFTRGNPSDWRTSASDVKAYAKSEIKQLDSEIRSTVEDVKIIDRKVEENKSEIIQQSNQIELKVNKDGIIGGLNASPETVKILSDRLDFNNATGVNVDLSGKITATSGKIGGYDLVDNKLKGNDVELGISQIKIKDAIISSEVWNTVENLDFNAIASNFGRPGRMVAINLAGDNFITQFSAGGRAVRVTSLVAMGDGDIGSSSRRFKNIFIENQPNVSSDARYKEEMTVFNNSRDMLRNINAYSYKMKGDEDSVHVGFKAQEVETYLYKSLYKRYIQEGMDKLSASRMANDRLNTIALLNKDESYLSLLYGELHTVLWQATKEMDEELQEVKNEVKELKDLVNKLLKERD